MPSKDELRKAIENGRKKSAKPVQAPKPKVPPTKPKPFVAGEKPSKRQRSAAARDARMKTRGRLPNTASVEAVWDSKNGEWFGHIVVPVQDPAGIMTQFTARKPGLFELCEALDVLYWEWVAQEVKK